jgi:hypothetical protein
MTNGDICTRIEDALVFEDGIEHALTCLTELVFEPYQRKDFFKAIKACAEERGWRQLESSSQGLRFTFEKVEEEE